MVALVVTPVLPCAATPAQRVAVSAPDSDADVRTAATCEENVTTAAAPGASGGVNKKRFPPEGAC